MSLSEHHATSERLAHVKIVVVLLLAAVAFGHRSTESELRCSLHCHGEPPVEITRLGWPVAYWSRDVEPGDPPRLMNEHFDPIALGGDVLVLGLVLCGVAITLSALRARPARTS